MWSRITVHLKTGMCGKGCGGRAETSAVRFGGNVKQEGKPFLFHSQSVGHLGCSHFVAYHGSTCSYISSLYS